MSDFDPTTRFDAAAGAYASGRPGYPAEIATWLIERAGLPTAARVLDLGAGTGELTAILLGAGLSVSAAEPSAPMRAVLTSRFPELEVSEERAEHLGDAAGSFDLVTAANALHWFEPRVAFPEIARVLREGACLAVIWNVPDLEDRLQAELEELRGLLPAGTRLTAWEEEGVPFWDEFFETVAERTWKHHHHLTPDGIQDFVGSWSAVANLSEDERRPVLERVREITGEDEADLGFIASVTLVRPQLGAGATIA
jgi:SAM-dependent methyltransferase